MTTTEIETAAKPALVFRSEIDAETGETLAAHWVCPCGSDDFEYRENYPTSRCMADNGPDGITFESDFEWSEGDDDPGVVCASCETELTVPAACSVDWA